ncbi:hypothetical protein GRX03_04800 [Halovenus sp. WSH3]|uniref:histidine kinase n=1 Tax=Halovenus carboxidivorans TaxID=2692199 RepID=A0A6B0T173_9EURY|nr:HAMP domain-containing sensor histidine kinase [Halovenus carboxidivorans]MXR50927.1 hypothetical protein [Halovenus carboxidivorans]
MGTADESGGRRPEAWLLDTLTAVSRAVTEADDRASLGHTVPDALTDPPENRAAWIGRTGRTDGTVRIHAGSPAVPETITGLTDSTTESALASGAVQILPAEDSPEYNRLRGAGEIAGAASVVAIPLPAFDGTAVLHLYTDGDISHGETAETFERISDLLATGFECRTAERELDRERERLEDLRSLVSHDLGNPINVAAGRLDLVRMDCESEHIEHVESALEQIEGLADEGVLFVKAGRELDERSELDLEVLARECWDLLDDPAASLEVEPMTVYAEPERLRMLLNQLLENAVVHTEGERTVTVGPLPDGEGFYVEDDGAGIPEDEREYVFGRGYTTVSEREGNGLALVEEAAGALDWEVSLGESAGTRVEIRTETW